MRWANAGPMPGSVSSSAADAALMFTIEIEPMPDRDSAGGNGEAVSSFSPLRRRDEAGLLQLVEDLLDERMGEGIAIGDRRRGERTFLGIVRQFEGRDQTVARFLRQLHGVLSLSSNDS